MGVRRFEDLVAWQKARQLTQRVYGLTGGERFAKDYGLKDQMQRAAVSVMSNIAEGFDRSGLQEFHQFLVIAKASCAEVRSQLYVALDIGYIEQEAFDTTHALAEELARIIGGLRASLKNRP